MARFLSFSRKKTCRRTENYFFALKTRELQATPPQLEVFGIAYTKSKSTKDHAIETRGLKKFKETKRSFQESFAKNPFVKIFPSNHNAVD